MCIDQGSRKIKKNSYFIIFVKTIFKILYRLDLQTPVTCSSVLMWVDILLLHACTAWCTSLQATGSSVNAVVHHLKFTDLVPFPHKKNMKVKIKASVKEHILSPGSNNCRTLSIQETFYLDFLNQLKKL